MLEKDREYKKLADIESRIEKLTKTPEIIQREEWIHNNLGMAQIELPEYSLPLTKLESLGLDNAMSKLDCIEVKTTNLTNISLPELNYDGIIKATETLEKVFEHKAFTALGEIALSMNVPAYEFKNPMLNKINNGIVNVVQGFSDSVLRRFAESTSTAMENVSNALVNAFKSPIIEWLENANWEGLYKALEPIWDEEERQKRYWSLRRGYLVALYECKWFPYATWAMDYDCTMELGNILSTSRGESKRRERRIDSLILSYYTEKEVKAIKKSWKDIEIEPHIKRILGQAIEAHLRGEYALCISSLSTMWEGIIYIKANDVSMQDRKRQRTEVTKKDLAKLTKDNGFDEILSDFFNNFIVSQCNDIEEVIDGVPNRHGVAHSWYRKYPSKKESLNAILLTDYIMHLEPTEKEDVA